jgi:hypothetical protein
MTTILKNRRTERVVLGVIGIGSPKLSHRGGIHRGSQLQFALFSAFLGERPKEILHLGGRNRAITALDLHPLNSGILGPAFCRHGGVNGPTLHSRPRPRGHHP